MRSGIGSSWNFRETDMPAMVEKVKVYQKKMLTDKNFALTLDGGSCKLVRGVKVVAMCALHPSQHDMLLDLTLMVGHETAVSQAAGIIKVLESLGLRKSQISHMGGDNAAVNKATADELNDKHGFAIKYIRCLPHCLNLVLVAFLLAFDERFGIASFLKKVRAFIKAGGGNSRRATLMEFALSLSPMDVVTTRWESLIRAIKYVMEKQTSVELKTAEKRLGELAASGDGSAADALAADTPPVSHWEALLMATESIEVDTGWLAMLYVVVFCTSLLIPVSCSASSYASPTFPTAADGEVSSSQDAILSYLCDINNWAAFKLLATALDTVPSVFRLIQGGQDWGPEMRDKVTAELPTAVSAVRNLITMLDSLDTKTKGKELVEEVLEAAEVHQERGMQFEIDAGNMEAGSLEGLRVTNSANRKVARTELLAALKKARASLRECAGREKLEEAVAQLKIKELYNLTTDPLEMPASNAQMYAEYGVPSDAQSFSFAAKFREQWALHRAAFVPLPVGSAPPSPAAVYDYWTALSASCPELGRVALHHWLTPVSSCSVERIFSFLTAMDVANRQRMDKQTLYNTLFLRGNQHIVDLLLQRGADAVMPSASGLSAKRAAEKRKAQGSAAAAAMAVLRAKVVPDPVNPDGEAVL